MTLTDGLKLKRRILITHSHTLLLILVWRIRCTSDQDLVCNFLYAGDELAMQLSEV